MGFHEYRLYLTSSRVELTCAYNWLSQRAESGSDRQNLSGNGLGNLRLKEWGSGRLHSAPGYKSKKLLECSFLNLFVSLRSLKLRIEEIVFLNLLEKQKTYMVNL